MKKRKPHFLWMEVSKDQYELPIHIADTAKELAELAGAKKCSNNNFCDKSRK